MTTFNGDCNQRLRLTPLTLLSHYPVSLGWHGCWRQASLKQRGRFLEKSVLVQSLIYAGVDENVMLMCRSFVIVC